MIIKLLFIVLIPLNSAVQDTSSGSFPGDSSNVNVRTVDSQTLQKITSEDVFNYHQLAKNPESLMSRIQRWLIQLIQYIFDNPWASVVIRFIFFAIFGIVLIALINQILGGNMSAAFSRTTSGRSVGLNITESNLSKIDYDKLLQEALSANNYHDAVRILYLKALQQLNETELIILKADKTNHDYLRELGTHPSKSTFSRLTNYYEYIEYGDFKIEKPGFENVQKIYRKFQEQAGLSA